MSQTPANNSQAMQSSDTEASILNYGVLGLDIPFSLGKMIEYSEKGGNPCGFEPMTKDRKVELSWAKTATNYLTEEDFKCLVDYYGRQYETPIVVRNTVKKIKKIKVLGYRYRSRLTGRNVGIDFNAYRIHDFENDDLREVDVTDSGEQLRAGSVDYFFCHQAEFVDKNNQVSYLDHYFAFVRWFKNPRLGKETLSQYTTPYMRLYRDVSEKKSSYCILPVHKLHTPVHMINPPFSDIIAVIDLPRRIL